MAQPIQLLSATAAAPTKAAARLRKHYMSWADRRHVPGMSTELGQRNIYILPTRSGLLYAGLLLALLVGAINYQLNLGYLLTFMLAGVGVMSMHLTHRNLRHLRLALQPVEPAHAEGVASLKLVLSVEQAERYAIALWCEGDDRSYVTEHASLIDVQPQSPTQTTLSMAVSTRGWQPVQRISLETRFPLGLWRAWSHWRPAGAGAQVLVYPKLESHPPPLPYWQEDAAKSDNLHPQRPIHTGEYDGVRPYRTGDAMKRVVWKKFAKADELVSRDDLSANAEALLLDYNSLAGLDTEARLSRLAAWVLACERQGLAFAMNLGTQHLPRDEGGAQTHAALRMLALYGDASAQKSASS
jgi:uncharacterized protein (DUF58 family)